MSFQVFQDFYILGLSYWGTEIQRKFLLVCLFVFCFAFFATTGEWSCCNRYFFKIKLFYNVHRKSFWQDKVPIYWPNAGISFTIISQYGNSEKLKKSYLWTASNYFCQFDLCHCLFCMFVLLFLKKKNCLK